MTPVFADTAFYIALLNPDDEAHRRAVEVTSALSSPVVTTAWVLTELGNGLDNPENRALFLSFLAELRSSPNIEIVSPDLSIWESGLELYGQRLDKAWSVVDCISFITMKHRGMTHALTTDHHFEQAGFVAMLK